MRTKTIAYSVLLSALGLVAPMAASVPASSAPALSLSSTQADLCFGQVPTIVAAEGENVVGTDGPDVVVAHGGEATVTTGDGDDLVCVIGVPERGQPPGTFIYAGSGNDRVDNSRSGFDYVTYLGDGADEYIGGAASETVSASEESQGPGPGPPDRDIDVIMTAGSSDRVVSGGGSDMVDLGEGRDSLYLRGLPGADGIFRGGGRSDLLYLKLVDAQPHSWTINNRAERLLRDGQLFGGWDSFEWFEVLGRTGPLTFLGSGQDERLRTRAQLWPLDLRMGGGDDKVDLGRGAPSDHRISGGEGTDELAYGGIRYGYSQQLPRDIFLDLSSGILRDARPSGGAPPPISFQAVNFENARVENPTYGRTVMRGTSGPNVLTATLAQATIYGMAGDDVLVGADFDDTLLGGTGHDIAEGSFGSDNCVAEVRKGCEYANGPFHAHSAMQWSGASQRSAVPGTIQIVGWSSKIEIRRESQT